MCNFNWTFVTRRIFARGAQLCALMALWASIAEASTRQVELSWDPKPQAKRYDFEVGTDASLTKLFLKKSVRESKIKMELPVNSYYYRVRWVNKQGVPSPWSGVEALPVNEGAPPLKFPLKGKRFAKKFPKFGIPFQWAPGVPGSKYTVEVRDKSGVVLNREAEKSYVWWKPTFEGKYSWRVCVQTVSSPECSGYQDFVVTLAAVDKVIREVAVERLVAVREKVRPLLVRANYLGGFQSGGGSVHTIEVNWSPEYKIGTKFSLGALLGVKILKAYDANEGSSAASNTIAINLGVLAGWNPGYVKNLSAEFGAGIFYWKVRDTSFVPTAMVNFLYANPVKSQRYIDRAFLGYEFASVPFDQIHFVKLGVGFDLGEVF